MILSAQPHTRGCSDFTDYGIQIQEADVNLRLFRIHSCQTKGPSRVKGEKQSS